MPLAGEYAPGRRKAARLHAERYEASNGAEGGHLGGHPVVVLTTVGARSGKLRKTALMRVEHDGRYALVAEPGTLPSRRPDWYYNVLANPVVELQDRSVKRDYRGREVEGSEREMWWQRAVDAFPLYANYQRRRPYPIPIVVLHPVGQASARRG
jgi:deazaflavin-dependent oxidoreductase (nitroreductase family)